MPEAYVVATGYTEGSTLTFTECGDGYTLKGQKEYTCVLNAEAHAQWSSEVDAECVGQCIFPLSVIPQFRLHFWFGAWHKPLQQESIPVGCGPTAP